jgi:hypothetical protein
MNRVFQSGRVATEAERAAQEDAHQLGLAPRIDLREDAFHVRSRREQRDAEAFRQLIGAQALEEQRRDGGLGGRESIQSAKDVTHALDASLGIADEDDGRGRFVGECERSRAQRRD